MVRRIAAAVAVGLALASCSGSTSGSSTAKPPAATAANAAWAKVDRGLAALGPKVGLLAARVTSDGTCRPIHEVAASTPRPTASQFKLFVLGALAEQIAAGRVSWQQTVPVVDAVKSLGNSEASGSLQFAAPGASVPVEEAATKMISISDNTAADLLMGLVGRPAVEAQVARWAAKPIADRPFLTTRQMLLLHYVPELGSRYLATPPAGRAAFLTESVDPLPIGAVAAGYSADPRYVEQIEWFASPAGLCRAFAGLQRLSKRASLAPVSTVMSRADFGIGLDPSVWPTVWFKGGSESGVLTLGWLATDRQGKTFVVEAMVSDPHAALAPESLTELPALAKEAFGLVR